MKRNMILHPERQRYKFLKSGIYLHKLWWFNKINKDLHFFLIIKIKFYDKKFATRKNIMVMLNDESYTNISSENDSGDKQRYTDKCCHTDLHKSQKDEKPNKQSTSHQNLDADTEDYPEALLNMLVQACKRLWQHINRLSLFVMNDLGGYQLLDRVAKWCVQHPQMAICITAAGLVAFLPILLFFIFSLSTIVMTLTGFLVLEGTLLTILTMIMFGLLGALAVVLLFFVLVGVFTYFGVSHVYDMYGSTEEQRNVLRSFMQKDNRGTSN